MHRDRALPRANASRRRFRSGRSTLVLVLALAALSASCALNPTGDLQVKPPREYVAERARGKLEPIILIPGVLGSKLFNVTNGEVAWGNFPSTISALTDDLDLPIDGPSLSNNRDNLRAYRVLDLAEVLNGEGSGEVRFYAEIIDSLTLTLGYRAAYGERFYRGHNLFVFFYDWRRSNVEAAAQLADRIRDIRRDLGAPDMKFTLLGVSNGGLIARYYARYGGADVVSDQPADAPLPPPMPEAAAQIHRVICLGTPHTGTLDSLRTLHEGYAPSPIARRQPPAAIFSFPAAFELLPQPGEKLFAGDSGEPVNLDLWDPATWMKAGLSVFSQVEQDRLRADVFGRYREDVDPDTRFARLTAMRERHLKLCLNHARRFWRAIAGPAPVPMSVICGATTPTLCRVGALKGGTREKPTWEFVFSPRVTLRRNDPLTEVMFAAGDGVVTRRSALGVALPESPAAVRRAGDAFRASLESFTFTPFRHRSMFEDDLLKLALADLLAR